jgi:hypothetical protein
MTRHISFAHAGGVGDIVYAIPVILSVLANNRATKADIFLQLDVETGYVGWHPLGNKLLDADFAARLKPLLESQPYIGGVAIHDGRKVDCDLNGFRKLPNLTTYCLPRWYFLFIQGTRWDLSQPWLAVPPDTRYADRILVSRNARLRSPYIDHRFMNEYASEVVFVGVEREFEEFRSECPACTSFYEATDFLELARVVAGARFFCGNQGFVYTLAEAMKTPRLLETNIQAANNIPTGPNCCEALFQQGFEHWFRSMRKAYPPRGVSR